MKKLLVILMVSIFAFSNLAFAKRAEKGGEKGKGSQIEERTRTEKEAKEMKQKKEKKEEKIKAKGKKTEPPKGVVKAAEKGKGKKKGLFRRWFGGLFGGKDKVEDSDQVEKSKGKEKRGFFDRIFGKKTKIRTKIKIRK